MTTTNQRIKAKNQRGQGQLISPVHEAVHEAVHALGRELITLRVNGHAAQARLRLNELYALHDELIRHLHALSAIMVQQRP